MDIYVLDNARSKDFIALCETIKINQNKTKSTKNDRR